MRDLDSEFISSRIFEDPFQINWQIIGRKNSLEGTLFKMEFLYRIYSLVNITGSGITVQSEFVSILE